MDVRSWVRDSAVMAMQANNFFRSVHTMLKSSLKRNPVTNPKVALTRNQIQELLDQIEKNIERMKRVGLAKGKNLYALSQERGVASPNELYEQLRV